ncbi:Defective in cullin neddylation protein [Entamoeba marina]
MGCFHSKTDTVVSVNVSVDSVDKNGSPDKTHSTPQHKTPQLSSQPPKSVTPPPPPLIELKNENKKQQNQKPKEVKKEDKKEESIKSKTPSTPVVGTPNPIEDIFEKYREEEKDYIGYTTITKFLGELGINEDDIGGLKALWVMWKLGSVEIGIISKNNFIKSMKNMKCDGLRDLQKLIPQSLPHDLRKNNKELKQFLAFAFTYNLEKSKQLEKDVTIDLLNQFYPDKKKHIEMFTEYLNLDKTPKLRKDEFLQLHDFFNSIHEDLKNFELDTTWPLLFDSYVEWKRSHQ